MIASGRSYIDIEAEVAEAGLKRLVQGEEWNIFHAENAVNPLAFDGLDVIITTNAVNHAGAVLAPAGVVIPAFDAIIKKIRNQGSGKIDAIFCSFGMQGIINAIVAPAARYFINVDQELGSGKAGAHFVSYVSPLGSVPVIGDFFVNPALPYPFGYNAGSSGPAGNSVSDIYFLRLDSDGFQMVDLVTVGRTELAKVADTVRFYINEYTVPAPKGEPWLAVLQNVSDPT